MDDKQKIEEGVQLYFDSMYESSAEKVRQAFHENAISTSGGVCIFFSLIIIYFNFFLFKNIFFLEYFSFCSLFFLLGLIDDIKINIKPKVRLLLMIILVLQSKYLVNI